VRNGRRWMQRRRRSMRNWLKKRSQGMKLRRKNLKPKVSKDLNLMVSMKTKGRPQNNRKPIMVKARRRKMKRKMMRAMRKVIMTMKKGVMKKMTRKKKESLNERFPASLSLLISSYNFN
jgi:TPP-dependent indolepyruvate ferredoxin oxidoreductase alpha subunit